ncbi:hypothetical protein HanIR_Chr07g0304051 [Helianthus annuus]|nr:hypothetical protein HanIR_Chr07g0304051 [Helianthus annuus]
MFRVQTLKSEKVISVRTPVVHDINNIFSIALLPHPHFLSLSFLLKMDLFWIRVNIRIWS